MVQDGPPSRLTTPFSPHDFHFEEADKRDLDTASRPVVDNDGEFSQGTLVEHSASIQYIEDRTN